MAIHSTGTTFKELSCCPHHLWRWLVFQLPVMRFATSGLTYSKMKRLCDRCGHMRNASGFQTGVCLPCRAWLCEGVVKGEPDPKTGEVSVVATMGI